jgi:hypothetical protein
MAEDPQLPHETPSTIVDALIAAGAHELKELRELRDT